MVTGTVKANVARHGVTGSNSRKDGYSAIATFIVSELSGDDDEGLVLDAMNVDGIPALGDAMPGSSYNALVVTNVTSKGMGSGSQFKVVVTYSQPRGDDLEPTDTDKTSAIISVETAIVETETAFDVEGKQIVTNHRQVSDGDVPGSVRFFAASTIVEYSRREPGDPALKSIKYVGALNKDAVIFGGDGPRTWMCTYLGGPSDDGGLSWNVTYRFQRSPKIGKDSDGGGNTYDAQPWDPLIVEIDPATGNHVLEPGKGKGKKIVKVQREELFSNLKLTIPTVAY